MKRLLAGAAALATAFVLAACSGGGAAAGGPNSGGGAVAAAGTGGGTPTTSSTTSAPPTSTSATPTPTQTPTSTTSKPKPTPTTTTTKPKPKPKPPASDPGVPCAAAAAAAGTAACVDISAHQAWILQGGKVVYGPVKQLPGRPSNPTPTGTFHVLSKEKMHLSKEFDNAEMPNSVFFYPGDAFHTGSLSVYSHGCIHLSPGASQKFFDTLHIGDIVQVVP